MDIGWAVQALRAGALVSRDAYNPTGDTDGVFLFRVPGTHSTLTGGPGAEDDPDLTGRELQYAEHIAIKTGDRTVAPWQPSQDALLAEDWYALDVATRPLPQDGGEFHISINPLRPPTAETAGTSRGRP